MRELASAVLVLSLSEPALELRPRQESWRSGERIAATAQEPGQALPLAPGTSLGEIMFPREWRDARGHRVAPGRYALRYVLQPRLKDHLGVDAVRDFALLVPIDATHAQNRLAAARHALDSRHPAVLALAPAPEGAAGEIRLDDGRLALVARLAGADGLDVAFVVVPSLEVADGL